MDNNYDDRGGGMSTYGGESISTKMVCYSGRGGSMSTNNMLVEKEIIMKNGLMFKVEVYRQIVCWLRWRL